MATLIKNIPNNATVAKGNRGLTFSLHTEWHSLLNVIPDLVIYTQRNMVISQEPFMDTAMLTEESIEEQNVFFVIPANPVAPQEVIGIDLNEPIERIQLI